MTTSFLSRPAAKLSGSQHERPAAVLTSLEERARPEEVDFEGTMRLMTSKYTCDLVDRHVAAVRKICKTCKQGFLLQHLDPLCEVLWLVAQRFGDGKREFAPAIWEFARVASLPFVSCKTSDMITYGHHLPDFIKMLVSVLSHTLPPSEEMVATDPEAVEELRAVNERIRIEVAHTLACWSRFGLDESSIELQPNQPLIQAVADSGTPNLRILQQSQVIDDLAACFRVEDSPEAIVITLGAIRDMSLYRPLARQITNCGLISNLVHVIRVNLLGSDVLLVAAEVLWNLLELDWEGAAVALGSADIIESFRDFMDAVFSRGYRFKDKIFRNDMMVLLMYVAKKEENKALFASTGLMSLLLSHAVSGHIRKALHDSGALNELYERRAALSTTGLAGTGGHFQQKVDPASVVPLTNSQEDIEFRILLWGTLARCCSDLPCAEIANKFGFVTSLLSYLDPAQAFHEQRQWSQEQRRKIQLEALSALFLLVQYTPKAFREANGNAIVLHLLQETNSREIQRKSLHLLQVAVSVGPEFSVELGALGAIGALIELFTDQDIGMGTRQLCISVLAGLCSRNSDNCREFRKKGGIEAAREQVVYRPDETTDNHLFYTLCVVDCVWCAIVGTRKNEVRFLDAGGLFGLLDVLEVAPMVLKRQIIGCLADLLQYRKAARLFVQWNSQVTMKGGLRLLLELWQSEQEATGSTGEDGVLKDLHRPLNPTFPPEDATLVAPPERASKVPTSLLTSTTTTAGKLRHAIAFSKAAQSQGGFAGTKTAPATAKSAMAATATAGQADGSNDAKLTGGITERQECRAKIWAILSCIGFEPNEALSIAERQQMELMKLYPTCVQLEAWIQLQENLQAKGVKPISADAQWIEDSIAEGKEQTLAIQDLQQRLADERNRDEKASLERFYEDIRSRAQFRRPAGGISRTTTPAAQDPNDDRINDDGGLSSGGHSEGSDEF